MHQRLAELKKKLSRKTQRRLEKLAEYLVQDEGAILEDVLWRAAGDIHGADFSSSRNDNAYSNLWRIIDGATVDKTSAQKFEQKYFAPHLQHEERIAPQEMINRLIEMMPGETLDRIVKLVYYVCKKKALATTDQNIASTEASLGIPWPPTTNLEVSDYAKERVKEYAKDVLNPWLEKIERQIKDMIIPYKGRRSKSSLTSSPQLVSRLVLQKERRLKVGEVIEKEFLRIQTKAHKTVEAEIYEEIFRNKEILLKGILTGEEIQKIPSYRAIEERHDRWKEAQQIRE